MKAKLFWLATSLMLMVTPALAAPPVRLMSIEKEQMLRKHFPVVDDKQIQAILDSDDLVLYTENEMPKAYQFSNSFHSPYYNIAALPDPVGNANRDFPWNHAGGADQVKNLRVFRFAKFPKKPGGGYWPMVYYNERLTGGNLGRDGGGSTWRWTFPKGMIFGELMAMEAPNSYTYAFELRLRFRDKESWDIECFRPFPTAETLSRRIKELRPNWKDQPDLKSLVVQLDSKLNFVKHNVVDSHRSKKGFASSLAAHPLPPITDKNLVAELLMGTRWSSAHGMSWKDGENKLAVAVPTVNAGTGFHIVPENYRASAFNVDSNSCMNCHKDTNHTASEFDRNREWYGRVRGSDGIFSFHPISRQSISGNGSRVPVQIRPELSRAGLAERFNPSRHTSEAYSKLGNMRE